MIDYDIYVLGITGLFGNDCTAFAKFFHPLDSEIDSNGSQNILNYLTGSKYFDEPKAKLNLKK